MDPTSPPTARRSGRARQGREVFSPDLGGGTTSTRWSPEVMRRTLSGGGSRELDREEVRGKVGGGKDGEVVGKERSPSFELIEPAPIISPNGATGSNRPIHPSIPRESLPPPTAAPNTTPIPPTPHVPTLTSTTTHSRPPLGPKIRLSTALQPVIHDLSQRSRARQALGGAAARASGAAAGIAVTDASKGKEPPTATGGHPAAVAVGSSVRVRNGMDPDSRRDGTGDPVRSGERVSKETRPGSSLMGTGNDPMGRGTSSTTSRDSGHRRPPDSGDRYDGAKDSRRGIRPPSPSDPADRRKQVNHHLPDEPRPSDRRAQESRRPAPVPKRANHGTMHPEPRSNGNPREVHDARITPTSRGERASVPSSSRVVSAVQSPIRPRHDAQTRTVPPAAPSRPPNGNFQDYLRRSQIGKKGVPTASRPALVVEKRKRVDAPVGESGGMDVVGDVERVNGQGSVHSSRSMGRLPPPPVLSPPPPPPPAKSTTKPIPPSPLPKSTTKSLPPPAPPGKPSTKARRLAEKQAQIARLIDEHDTVLREMFHLEKFKTMVVGYDPREAKKETSNVWKEWQAPFDLINKFITSQKEDFSIDGDSGVSSRRTTRRKMAEQVINLPLEVLLGIPPSLRIVKEEPKVDEEDVDVEMEVAEGASKRESRVGREDEGTTQVPDVAEERASRRDVRVGKGKDEGKQVPDERSPPPPPRAKPKSLETSKRKPAPITVDPATPIPETDSFTLSPVQPRPSKKRRIATPSDVADDFQLDLEVSHRPTVARPPSTQEKAKVARPAPTQEKAKVIRNKPRPVQVYSLPPAPPPRYTCPEQFPAHRPPSVPAAHVIFASPKLTEFPKSRDAASVFPAEVLSSFVMLEADGEVLTDGELKSMAEAQVDVVRRVIELQMRGRRILGPDPDGGNAAVPRSHVSQPHHAAIHDDALRYRTHMLREQKFKSNQLKKIVKAVQGYWNGIASREERRAKDEERRVRAGAREIAKAVKAKWKLAANVIRMKKQAEAKAEQERLGREHLRKILERSENMIKKRKRGKKKPKREESQPSEASPQSSPEQTIYDLYAGDMADDELAHGTDDEAPAELDMEEEEAAKTYERTRMQDGLSDTAARATLWEPNDNPYDDGIFVDVPELTAAEKRTYSRYDLKEQLGTREGSAPASSGLQQSAGRTTSVAGPSREPTQTLAPISELSTLETNSASEERPTTASAPVDKVLHSDLGLETEFGITADLEDEDRRFDEEMLAEDAEIVDSDDEDEGLLRDAELPIEELLARYGYKVDTPGDPMQVDDPAPGHLDTSVVGSDDSADSDDEGDRQNIDESVAAASEPSNDSDTESTTDVEQVAALPFLLRANLRPYQRDGLSWLARLYQEKTNAILADEMGLGKTLQTIALLAHLACDHQEWGPHLIIVPTSVILNWEMEFKKFLPGFKVLTYYGNQQERKERRKGWFAPHAFQVCITSYQIAIADQAMLRRRQWQYLILDEAHNIKNFRSQRWQTLLGFKSERRLLLTGTPLQNNLMELWSLMYFLMPSGLSDDLSKGGEFANHQDFSDWFSNPMDKAVESGDGISPEARETVNRLHVILRPFILRRLKAEVEKQLPAKFEHTLYCNLSKRQQYLYDEFMSRSSTRQSLVSGGYLGIANCLMQLRKVCNHPDLFEVRPIATSFAMKQSVVSPFLGTFATFQGVAVDPTEGLQLGKLTSSPYCGDATSMAAQATARLDATLLLPFAQERSEIVSSPPKDTRTVDGWKLYRAYEMGLASRERWSRIRVVNRDRCHLRPLICSDMLNAVRIPDRYSKSELLDGLMLSNEERLERGWPVIQQYAVVPPKATALEPLLVFPEQTQRLLQTESFHRAANILHPAAVKLQIAFPDKTLLQYDCGKLQKLAGMLKNLQAGGHRVLIFTQMTKMLDILETFLSHGGYRYSRLDGSTKVEDRLLVTERFNNNPRIFAFIASTRSGGVGINLTGADTVIFYDNEFNPAMDKQAMDRAHRIGQTREVHIYRLVTRHTVEENMLKKANQKRLLDDVVMQEGNFTTDYLSNNASKGKSDLRDLLGQEAYDSLDTERPQQEADAAELRSRATSVATVDEREMQHALEQVQDTEDIEAAKEAAKEIELDDTDFTGEFDKNATQDADIEESQATSQRKSRSESATKAHGDVDRPLDDDHVEQHEPDRGMEGQGNSDDDAMEDDTGAIDEYMLRIVEWDWSYFV